MSGPHKRTVVYDYQTFCLQAYGGISRYFCELAERIDQSRDFRARIVAPLHFNSHLAASKAMTTGVYVGSRSPAVNRLCRAASRSLSPMATRRHRPSLIHRTFYRPLPRPPGTRVVLTVFDMIHEVFAAQFGETDAVRRDKQRCVDEADHVLCISESTAHDLMRLFQVPRAKISVTHLGYSPVFDQPAADDLAPPGLRPFVLYVGHRDGYKNFERLLRAYAASATLNAAFDLQLFGGPPLTRAERALALELGLPADRIRHTGGHDQVLAKLFRRARLLVYPSEYEGFGIPPLEAMASGCAVACANTSSLPEVVGDAAALFDPREIDAIRGVIEAVCFDDARHASLVAAGRLRARLFSWDRCAEDTLAAYRKLTGEAQSRT